MEKFGNVINNSFYFVVDKIFSIQGFFIDTAYDIGRVILLIALLSAGLNYALTGTGLKENLIKILKATLFFFIVTAAYPTIIGWITNTAYSLAEGSVGNDVEQYFNKKLVTMEKEILQNTGQESAYSGGSSAFGGTQTGYGTTGYMYTRNTYNVIKTLSMSFYTNADPKLKELFNSIKEKRQVTIKKTMLKYTTFAPANVVKLLFMTADSAFDYSDNAKKEHNLLPEFSVVLKGLICGFFLIFTGVFALVEYLVCFLEFALVASVGIMLLPMSIWEGSKFLSEKFIGAIVGFFMKLLFCNIAIFLLLYGFVGIFNIIGTQKFDGSPSQITFIVFSCLLFFVICKSAPGIAQSLLTGVPSLNAAGAIGAVAGAAGAIAATAGFVKSSGSNLAAAGGSLVGGAAKTVNTLSEASAAFKAAGANGGNAVNQATAFMSSLGKNASQSLARSIYGQQSGGKTMGEVNNERKLDGSITGVQHMIKKRSPNT